MTGFVTHEVNAKAAYTTWLAMATSDIRAHARVHSIELHSI